MTRDEFENLLEVNGIAFVGEAAWRVAQLVAAHEREECAKVCEAQQNMAVMSHPARIEVEQSTQNMMALKCAGLIRARGQ